jgi:hypothetical protein
MDVGFQSADKITIVTYDGPGAPGFIMGGNISYWRHAKLWSAPEGGGAWTTKGTHLDSSDPSLFINQPVPPGINAVLPLALFVQGA